MFQPSLSNSDLPERSIGNQKHYRANPASPVFAELCAVARKSFALADPLREALKPLDARIEAAFVYGSVASREWTKRVSTRSAFASRLMTQPKIWLIGNEDVLRA